MSEGSDSGFYSGYNPRVHARVADREGFNLGNPDEPITIWVGNLDPAITDEFLATLFNQIGSVVKSKVIFDGLNDPYAFVEFTDHNQAAQALQSMNKRILLDKEMKLNWAVEPGQPGDRNRGGPPAVGDNSRHFHVFVGDLSSEVDTQKLKEAFEQFGDVSEAKVIRDSQTSKSKGYGFVSFPKREEAERAMEQMNGQWLGRRTIRTNWASRKPEEQGGGGVGAGGYGRRDDRHHHGDRHEKSYEEVFNSTSPDNTSVYVGNIATLTEDDLRQAFNQFGPIAEIRLFKMSGYAFVKFERKENACKAIVQMNNQEIHGQNVRCSWGKNAENKQERERGGGGGGNFGNYGYGGNQQGPPGPGNFGPPGHGGPPGPPGGPPGGPGPSGAQNSQYWQYYSQYYNNPQLMQQWSNYWQNQGPRGGPGGHGGGHGHGK